MTPLRILLTNTTLGDRGGSSLYIRDVATALLARGHHPIVYSPLLGTVAEDLRIATVPVVDNLDAVGVAPDVIHGQHHMETMTALLHFPGVPAVFCCHGWLPWPLIATLTVAYLFCRGSVLIATAPRPTPIAS
jgi:hypothetical protein